MRQRTTTPSSTVGLSRNRPGRSLSLPSGARSPHLSFADQTAADGRMPQPSASIPERFGINGNSTKRLPRFRVERMPGGGRLERGGVMTLQSPTMPRRLPPGCYEDTDRHGVIRIYYRAKATPRRLAFAVCLGRQRLWRHTTTSQRPSRPDKGNGIAPGTWRWLCVHYFAECAEYKRLDARTQHVRRQILEATFDEPIAPGRRNSSANFRFPNDGGCS